jgi:tRNA(Ile)-lysidine synthase
LDLLKDYKAFIQQNHLFHLTDKLLLAVSGGAGSVVLAWLMKIGGYAFSIAHCNFQLRGEESNRDEAFVAALAHDLEVPFYLKRFETTAYAESKKVSIQVAARELRYEWFNSILDGKAFDDLQRGVQDNPIRYQYLITAHHQDDNIETVLMNFCKGTGINGLKGIMSKQDRLVRPLLFASKEEILAFAEANQLSWVEDSSNEEVKYTRNYLRKVVIPTIEKIFSQVQDNIADSIERFKDVAEIYNQSIALTKKRLVEVKGTEFHIPVLKLLRRTSRRTLIYEIIKEYGFSSKQVAEVEKLLSSESGKYCTSSTHRILRNRAWLIISPLEGYIDQVAVVEKGEDSVYFDNKHLHLKRLKGIDINVSTDNTMAAVDVQEIQFPLIVRKWKQGDYFYPLGMRKKKKLARFFIDQKLSLTDKEKVWVVESHKKIVWVIGLRIDDRFKITPTTREALQLSISNL